MSREAMKQPEALRWANILEHQAKYDGPTDYKHKAAVELRWLHEVNQDLLEILKQLSECDLNENNCATLDVVTKRIRSVASAAIAKATGDKS